LQIKLQQETITSSWLNWQHLGVITQNTDKSGPCWKINVYIVGAMKFNVYGWVISISSTCQDYSRYKKSSSLFSSELKQTKDE
jgi:hypothetical protein